MTLHLATKIGLATIALGALAGRARADAAPPPPPPHAIVLHVAPITAAPGEAVELAAAIDAPYAEALVVRWRAIGDAGWRDARFERSSAGNWFATLPPAPPPGLEYYIAGTDARGGEALHFASPAAPHQVHVEPTLADRLEAQDRARLGARDNEVSFEVVGHDFGNRYGHADQFVRGEVVYTRRVLRALHEVGFGFGTVDGSTPAMAAPDAAAIARGLRYGFGQVRLRLHPSLFVDGRVGLGVSQDGFEQNARGVVTFGKPWRSSVAVGAEYLGGLGPTAWVRLQWDTAPPLLMGASVVRTDLPGAVLARGGLYVAYDVAYRITGAVSVRGQLSYGARDGAAHFGGGLGTALAF